MHKLTTLFLYTFFADGVLSIMDLFVRRNAPGQMPGFLAITVTYAVLILGLLLFLGMVLTPRLSKRLLLPPIVFLGFCLLWGVLFGEREGLLLSTAEVFLGLGLLVGFWNPQKGGLQDFTSHRPRFTFRNFVGTGLLHGFLSAGLAGLLILGLAQKLRGALESSTGSYLTIQPGGVLLEERRFQREGKEIRLIGMIHIAKSGFYDEVARALPAGSKAVVLLEGISDSKGLLKGKLSYSNIARMLGFTSQQESAFTQKAAEGLAAAEKKAPTPPPLEYRRADLDTAEFQPETVHWIEALGNVLQSANFKEACAKYSASRETLEKEAANVSADLLDKRNAHLLEEIRKGLDGHTLIIVPWGARHMPDVQKGIEQWGFVETSRLQHQAVHFQNKTLIGFLACVNRMPN